MNSITWDTLDWTVLDRLREIFLAGQQAPATYWTSLEDLANYNFTYAQRIGWKWDAVIDELKRRSWTPPGGTLLDWGCGSGIASRRVIASYGTEHFASVGVSDHSGHAVQFAAATAREFFPGLKVTTGTGEGRIGTLVISHVLNELNEVGGRALREVIDRSDAVIWVEPGTFADSRALIQMRESLRTQFHVIAPCTHQATCGLLAPANERHWCHHFASPPPGIMADSDWVKFANRAGIDLRSLPYSFVVLERRGVREAVPSLAAEGCSRILGEPRIYKGYAKVLACASEGVRELELQKREAPEVYKAFKGGESSPLWRWEVEGVRIRNPKPAHPES